MTFKNDLKRNEVCKRILKTVTMNERIKRPSFMIKDILGNSETRCENGSHRNERVTSKPCLPTLPIPSSVPLPYFAYQPTSIPHGLPGMRHPGHVPFMLPRGCYPVEPFLEPRDPSFPVPIPLPVYIRTRSPMGDCFSKPKKCRRSRTVFTELQLMGLEKKFESHKYLSTPDRIELAETLGLSQIQVKTWYQNRRMKWKKQVMLKGGTEPPTKPKGRPKKNSFDIPELSHSNCSSDIIVDSDSECSESDDEFIDITNNDQIVSSSSVDN